MSSLNISSYGTPSVEYVAGFFDGEGCISISRTTTGMPRLMVLYTNTDLQLLEAIQRAWGGRIYQQTPNRGPLTENRPSYILQFNTRADAERFLRAIEPALRIKREQALNAIQFLEIKRGLSGRQTPEWARDRLEDCWRRARFLSSRNLADYPDLSAIPEEDDEYEQTEMAVIL